jgi:hypothetical protein
MAKLSDHHQIARAPQAEPHETSPVTVAAVAAVIATLFAAGIAGAFIYTRNAGLVQQAAAPLPPPAIYQKAPVETTGSGGGQ